MFFSLRMFCSLVLIISIKIFISSTAGGLDWLIRFHIFFILAFFSSWPLRFLHQGCSVIITLCFNYIAMVQLKGNLILMGDEPACPLKWHVCKIHFCAGKQKLHIANNDCHRHALHKHPLQVALHACITRYSYVL